MADRDLGSQMNFWIGVVTNAIGDPLKSGRVQIRVVGRHDDKTNIPDDVLPWAVTMQSGPTMGGVGRTTHYIKGTQLMGFWMDKDYQIPVIMGTVPKSGNLKPGQTVSGVPSIDSNLGSIPSFAYGSNYSNYTALNPNRPSITAINAGLATIDSISKTAGVVYSQAVQKLFAIPLYPTTASASKKTKKDVLKIIKQVDPKFLNSALPCMVPNFSKISLGNILSSLGELIASALVGALLAIAAKLGLFKVLDMINKALAAAAGLLASAQQILSTINSLANIVCMPSPINQNLIAPANLAIAQAMQALNSAVGWTAGALSNPITAASAAAVNSLLSDHSSSAPKRASVATVDSPVPSPIVATPPDNFVQVYYEDSDPYPGYITYEDPDNVLPEVYTLRNGEPLYTSAEEHTHHVTQQHMASGLEASMTSGNFTIDSMIAQVTASTGVASVFAAGKILGAGFAALGAVAILAFALPTLGKTITSIFQPHQKRSKLKKETTQKPVDDFAEDQAELEQKMKKMRTAVQGSASDTPLPTPPVPPEPAPVNEPNDTGFSGAPTVGSQLQAPPLVPEVTATELGAPGGGAAVFGEGGPSVTPRQMSIDGTGGYTQNPFIINRK